jgi:hypothetical protein
VPDKGYGMRKCKVFGKKKYYPTLKKEVVDKLRNGFLIRNSSK